MELSFLFPNEVLTQTPRGNYASDSPDGVMRKLPNGAILLTPKWSLFKDFFNSFDASSLECGRELKDDS